MGALVIAAAGVFVLFASNEPYGSWMQLVIVQRDIMQLTWPLALAAGAWQALRERRSRVEELLATTPRRAGSGCCRSPPRWRSPPSPPTWSCSPVRPATWSTSTGTSRGAIPLIALGALAMVAAVWLGQAIGTLLPSPLTAPMLAVVGFVGLAVSPMIVAQDSRDRGAVCSSRICRVRATVGSRSRCSRPGRTCPRRCGWRIGRDRACRLRGLPAGDPAGRPLPVVLGAAIAVPAMPRTLSVAWVDDRRATEVVCTDDTPGLHLAAALPRVGLAARPGPQALSVLAAKLPPAPTRVVVEITPTHPWPPAGRHAADGASPFALEAEPRRTRPGRDT